MLNKEDQQLFYKKIGEAVKAARLKDNCKQDVLAKHLGLNRISVVNIEHGKQKVQLHTLIQIADYLRVRLEDLVPPLELITPQTNNIDRKLVKTIAKELEQVDHKEAGGIRVTEFVKWTKSKS